MVDAVKFEALVQRNMALNAGVNFQSMADFLATIAVRQLERLQGNTLTANKRLLEAFSLQRCTLALKALAAAVAEAWQQEASLEGSEAVSNANWLDWTALRKSLESLRSCSSLFEVYPLLQQIILASERCVSKQAATLETGSNHL